jgi:hypothetical protein
VHGAYYDLWEKDTHAVRMMGGHEDLVSVEYSLDRHDQVQEDVNNLKSDKPLVGVMFSASQAMYNSKAPDNDINKEIVKRLKAEGYAVVQLGAPFETSIDGVDYDLRYDHPLDSALSAKFVDCLVTLDCFMMHSAKAVGQKNCVVLWGGSGNPDKIGYKEFQNVVTRSSHRCFGSLCTTQYRTENCCRRNVPLSREVDASGVRNSTPDCIKDIDLDDVMKAVSTCLTQR